MNREIKYRQPIFNRDGSFNSWHYWGTNIEINGDFVNVGWMTFSLDITDPKQSQEFTGLKDKNGVDIYDGDILKKHYGSSVPTFKVMWSNERAMFIQCDGYNEPLFNAPMHYCEIIGNIYENPELLNK